MHHNLASPPPLTPVNLVVYRSTKNPGPMDEFLPSLSLAGLIIIITSTCLLYYLFFFYSRNIRTIYDCKSSICLIFLLFMLCFNVSHPHTHTGHTIQEDLPHTRRSQDHHYPPPRKRVFHNKPLLFLRGGEGVRERNKKRSC